jgi:hypothetical protein
MGPPLTARQGIHISHHDAMIAGVCNRETQLVARTSSYTLPPAAFQHVFQEPIQRRLQDEASLSAKPYA